MAGVSSESVRQYEGLVVSLARPLVGRAGAELDDLVQEGLIAVWQSLERGVPPSSEFILLYMRNWIKRLNAQTPSTWEDLADSVSYDTVVERESQQPSEEDYV